MSMDPTYNPYAPKFADDLGEPGVKAPLKGFVKVVCIFFIILGALGLLQTLQAIVVTTMAAFMESSGEANAMNGMNPYPGAMAVGVLFAFISFVVSVCEIMAGVMGLQQKRLGANLIRFTSAFMMVFKVIETVYGCVLALFTFGQVKEQTMKQMQADPNSRDMGFILDIGLYVGLGFVVLIGLVMFVFYLFAFLSFSKQQTLSQFS